VGYETFVKQALTHAPMVIPRSLLGTVVLLTALAGLLASVLPARRAARATPAAGLSLDRHPTRPAGPTRRLIV
jgi:putative ABC transport system permease protein